MTDHKIEDGTDHAEGDTPASGAVGGDDERGAPSGGPDAGGPQEGAAEGTDRLQALEEDIEEVRRKVADPLDQGDRKFIEKGDADEGQPVDDTIVPG